MNKLEIDKIDELLHNLSLLNLCVEGATYLLEGYTGNKEYGAALVEQVYRVKIKVMELIYNEKIS